MTTSKLLAALLFAALPYGAQAQQGPKPTMAYCDQFARVQSMYEQCRYTVYRMNRPPLTAAEYNYEHRHDRHFLIVPRLDGHVDVIEQGN